MVGMTDLPGIENGWMDMPAQKYALKFGREQFALVLRLNE